MAFNNIITVFRQIVKDLFLIANTSAFYEISGFITPETV
jgi:uncharacterized protein (UPF0262 family)